MDTSKAMETARMGHINGLAGVMREMLGMFIAYTKATQAALKLLQAQAERQERRLREVLDDRMEIEGP